MEEAVVEGGVDNDTFQRMLGDLSREYSRISSENASLRLELRRMRVSTASGYLQDDLPAGDHEMDDSTVYGAVEPTSNRPPVLCIGAGYRLHGTEAGMRKDGNADRATTADWDDDGVMNSELQETISETANPVSADWRNVEDGLADPTATNGEIGGENPVREQLVAQYHRLLGDGGARFLGSKQLHRIVSQFECKQYGHNKHHKNKVAKTMKQINDTYGEEGTPTRGPYGVILSEDTFVNFMDPMNDMKGGEDDDGEDFEYLKKALRVEETEYMADEARKDIARKRENEMDPEPEGYFQIYTLEVLPPIVIFVNALAIGLQADIGQDWLFWNALEMVFLAFYLTEFYGKIHLLGCRRFFRGIDAYWNWFDVLCIIASTIDLVIWVIQEIQDKQTINLKVLRLARLVRIIKSFRYKFFDDLKVMALGVLSGAKVLAWAVLLFFLCVFVIAVLMREIFGGDDQWGFQSMPQAMFTVFRCFTDGCTRDDGTPLHSELQTKHGFLFTLSYIIIFLVVTFGVFNLIIAVFIDSVSTTTVKRKQRELGKREEEMKISIEEILVKLVRSIYRKEKDEDVRPAPGQAFTSSSFAVGATKAGAMGKADILSRALASTAAMAEVRQKRIQISRELFNTWLSDKEFLQVLEEVEIDTATKYEIFDVCDVDKSGSLTCDELVSGLMRLRGPISKCDVIAIRLKVRYLTKMLEDIHHKVRA